MYIYMHVRVCVWVCVYIYIYIYVIFSIDIHEVSFLVKFYECQSLVTEKSSEEFLVEIFFCLSHDVNSPDII